jgi:hypothetical protein
VARRSSPGPRGGGRGGGIGVFRGGSALGLALLVSFGDAPFQCASDPDPRLSREDEPGEALYALAEKFEAEGDERAWRTTLEYLIHQYPASRFAKRAEDDLAAAGTHAAP